MIFFKSSFFCCFAFLVIFVVHSSILSGQKIHFLSKPPIWEDLDPLQKTITKKEFVRALKTIYTPNQTNWDHIELGPNYADIRKMYGKEIFYRLHFSDSSQNAVPNKKKPFIILDPGHIGGEFAEMEFRHFQIPGYRQIREGEITLNIAKILKKKLVQVGYRVELTRTDNQPVTEQRPKDFKKDALEWFCSEYKFKTLPKLEELTRKQNILIENRKNLLFYRTAEIHARAKFIHQKKPDLVICLHVNAAPWPKDGTQKLANDNHMHFLVNGTYLKKELHYDSIRYHMIYRILRKFSSREIEVTKNIAFEFVKQKTIRPFVYLGKYASSVDKNPYIWSRNLLANRIYDAPVSYLEPFVANGKDTFEWLNEVENSESKNRVSFVEFYSQNVAQGIIEYFNSIQSNH